MNFKKGDLVYYRKDNKDVGVVLKLSRYSEELEAYWVLSECSTWALCSLCNKLSKDSEDED